MASIIKVRTISAATETAIQLSNSQFARTLNFGTSWTTIRFGMRLHMDNTGVAISGTPRFACGFCSGTTNIFGDATTANFVGIISTGASWLFQTTFYNSTLFAPCTRVGSTLTTGTGFAGASDTIGGCRAGTNVADRGMFFVDLIKGSPNFTVRMFALANTQNDSSAATFLNTMEQTTPSASGYTYEAGQTVAVNEGANGILDSINVSWNQTTPVVEICDIAVARIA